MNAAVDRRHALGLPAGSIRATQMLVIVGLACALILSPRDITIPPYLIYLLFLMLGHYFASRSGSSGRDSGPAPLYLPGGSVRFLVILALGGAIGWKMYQNPDGLREQFEASVEGLKDQPYLPILILGGFFAGVVLRTVVGRANPPQWLQDFEAWISIVALVGLGIAAVIHLIVVPSLEVPLLPLPRWEGILGAVIAFYFGERSEDIRMVIWALAKKELRLLMRDTRAMVILLAMPLIFILVLGVSLGEGFGQKPADRLRVSVLVLDQGLPRHFDRPAMLREGTAWLAALPNGHGIVSPLGAWTTAGLHHRAWFPHEPWSALLLRDLNETADIRVELIESRTEAQQLVRSGRRAAVLILGPQFSKRVERCSFLAGGWQDAYFQAATWPKPGDPVALAFHGFFDESQTALPLYLFDGLNPFHRDGVKLDVLDVEVLKDPTQQTASAIIDQVAQGSLLRVVMPWMIGRAFEKVGDRAFLELLGKEEQLPAPVRLFLTNPLVPVQQKRQLSVGLQNSLQNLFSKYNLTAKTWAALTKADEHMGAGEGTTVYREEGSGWLKRGAIRYQLLVPSYLVMFAFFLVLTVGWLFVAERRQGTMKRLRAAPLTRAQIVAGKLLPCLVLSLFQGFLVLLAGKLIFAMSWGSHPGWLALVVASTSVAAMGLGLLVAALARTEAQVAIYGPWLVLVLAALSGSLMGDRSLMPEQMQTLSRITPHAWALDAYRQLLANPGEPNLELVAFACAVLAGFGVGFLLLAWWFLKLE